ALAMRLVRFFFPLVLLLPLNGLSQILFPGAKLINELIAFGIAIAIMGMFEVTPWHNIILRASIMVVMVLSPFFLITISQAFWSAISVPHPQLAASLNVRTTARPRVLWLLFDEMDQRVAFSNRPANLELPELDRLRSQSLYGINVYPPSDSTLVSVPALISGKLLSNAELVSQSKLMITFGDTERPVSWNSEPNLFSEAREAGFNTAFIGWYLPCCDILPESLTSCAWIDTEAATLRESMSKQIEGLMITIPFIPALGNTYFDKEESNRNKAVKSHIGVLEAAKRVVVDSDVGLMLVYWQVAHPPNIYRRDTDEFEVKGESSYVDNLRLIDRTVGELRRVMEDSGTWENTYVLLTSDHWWRSSIWRSIGPWTSEDAATFKSESDHRVPFILKLAGQKHPVTYDPVFNNVLSHDLILALLRSELSGPDSVVQWLDQHRSIGQSPYLFNSPN
ncbi:MAG: sulfatase-like hydrolase/transferase, partial [Blastocatellia bacterium]